MNKRIFFFGIILFLLALRNKEAVLLLQIMTIIVIFSAKINLQAKKYAILLSFPLFISGFYGLHNFPIHDVLKDFFYFLNPILFIILGSKISKIINNEKTFIKICILFGTILSCVHIFAVLYNGDFGAILDPRVLRDEYGIRNYVLSVAALFLLISYTYNWKVPLFGKFGSVLCIVLNLFSLYLSGSRTDILFFLSALLSVLYLRTRHGILTILLVAAAGLGVWYGIQLLPDSNKTAIILKNSFSELSFRGASDAEDRNTYYRGWESYRTWVTYKSGNEWELFAGQGMGAMTDLGVEMILGGEEAESRQFIPFLHNGYMYLLLKSGLFGSLLFSLFYYSVFREALNRRKREEIMAASLLTAIFVTNALIATIFNYSYVIFWLLIGAFLYHSDTSKKMEAKYNAQKTA